MKNVFGFALIALVAVSLIGCGDELPTGNNSLGNQYLDTSVNAANGIENQTYNSDVVVYNNN